MQYKNILIELHKGKTPIFINGNGVGKITKVEEDYIDFEVIREEEEKKEKKLFKEITQIQISNITTISTGEKEIPKTEQDKKIDDDLGAI